MLVIGLMGKAYSGKSTVAKHLETKGFKRLAFAGLLKDLAQHYFKLTEEEIETKPLHVRTLLQGLGMLIREQFDPEIFINEVFLKMKYSGGNLFVIEDVRLAEEAEFIKSLGGVVARIDCPDSPHRLAEGQESHETEKIDAIPYDVRIIARYGDLKTLECQEYNSLKSILGGLCMRGTINSKQRLWESRKWLRRQARE